MLMFESPSRRRLLRLAARGGLLGLSGSPLLAASDFWNKKAANDWSDEEVVTLKTKSPWARKVHLDLPAGGGRGRGGAESMDRGGSRGTFGGMSGADSNGISEGGGRGGGGRGGGGGGGGDFGGGAPGTTSIEIVVRWESARPLVERSKLQLPPAFADHYAVSVTGLPQQLIMMILTGGGRGRGREGAPAEAAPAEDPAARQKAAYARLLASATLSAKGKDPEPADQAVQTSDRQSMIFAFPKQSLPLSPDDKDVQFTMKLGNISLKAKFEPKEMTYKGELAL